MVTEWARSSGARLLQPIARALRKMGMTPNAITVLGLVLTGGVAILMAGGRTQLAGVLLILTLGTDALDGTMARLGGNSTRFGAFLDSTLDRWAEVLVFGALVWHYLWSGQDFAVLTATAAMAGSLLVSYTRARAEGVGLSCKEGFFTRFERLAILIGGLILGQAILALAIIALLSGFTAVQRIWITWQADQVTD